MRLTRLAGTCTVLAIPCALLLAQEPRPLESPEEAGRKAEVEAATQAEQALEKSLKDLRARRKELAEEGPGRRSAADIPELEEGGRIVNGVATIEFPGVGALVKGASPDSAGSWCTGTLVGCRTFLTANHCVRADRRPGSYHVYFQNLGFVAVEAVSPPHPDYAFPHADLAVLRLAQPVDGLPVTAINRAFTVPNQTPGTLVGFGRTGGLAQDYGVKRKGSARTASCDRAETSLLCWDFLAPVGLPGVSSNTCNADSGGPLFVRNPAVPAVRLLAGVTSGGTRDDCLAGDHSYDVDVRQFADWVSTQAGADLGATQCGSRPLVEAPGVRVLSAGRQLKLGEAQAYKFRVPEGFGALMVAMNGTDSARTNLNLFVKRGSAASVTGSDCARDGSGNYAACRFDNPAAGDWFLRIDQQGQDPADFQVVVTMFPKPAVTPSPAPSQPPGP